jgi:hypothetical protein
MKNAEAEPDQQEGNGNGEKGKPDGEALTRGVAQEVAEIE